MQVIITMAGLSQRFKNIGENIPKPFISLGGKSVLKHLTDTLPSDWKLFFAIGEHLKSTLLKFESEDNLDSFLEDTLGNIQLIELEIKKLNKKNYEIIYVPYSKRGPIDTVAAVLPYLNKLDPVIVSYCDYTMIWNAEDFIEKIKNSNSEAAVVSYKGFHPTYLGPNSYCHLKVCQDSFVEQLQEKKLFTDHIENEWTSCGMYYFKSTNFLEQCLSEQLLQKLFYLNAENRDFNQSLIEDGEYYTSLALQAMKNKNPNLKILNYEIKYFIQFGTPFDAKLFKYWNNYFNYSMSSK